MLRGTGERCSRVGEPQRDGCAGWMRPGCAGYVALPALPPACRPPQIPQDLQGSQLNPSASGTRSHACRGAGWGTWPGAQASGHGQGCRTWGAGRVACWGAEPGVQTGVPGRAEMQVGICVGVQGQAGVQAQSAGRDSPLVVLVRLGRGRGWGSVPVGFPAPPRSGGSRCSRGGLSGHRAPPPPGAPLRSVPPQPAARSGCVCWARRHVRAHMCTRTCTHARTHVHMQRWGALPTTRG